MVMGTNGEEYPYDSYEAIVTSALAWTSSYVLLRYVFLKEKTSEFSCRIVTFFHGLTMSFYGFSYCFWPDIPFKHPEWETTDFQRLLMVTSLGYFIFDLIWCLFCGSETTLMICHHIYSLVALFKSLPKKFGGAQSACALGSLEVTNPILQARWFIRSAGFYPSVLHTSVEVVFFIIFIIVRIIIGTYFLMIAVSQENNDPDYVIFSGIIYILSWMFVFNMFTYIQSKYIVKKTEE